jgi:hypothetical protein
MSAESQPDPILPNYNPSSWDIPTLSPEERAILDTEYITFPIAQNQNITFPVAPTAPTLANGTNTTQVATTGFVQNAITAFKSASNIWSGIQTFSAGITTATISAISGTFTLTGATTVSNATFSGTTTLSNPFTPAYAYAANGSTGVGKLGETITGTNVASLAFSAGVAKTISEISSLSAGVWLFSAQIGRGLAGGYLNCCISLTTDSFAAPLVADSYQTTGSTGPLNTFSFILYVPDEDIPYYFVGQADTGSPFNSVIFKALRLF